MAVLTLRSGVRVDYEVQGQGPDLFQVGAGQLNRHNYEWVSPYLASGFRLVTFDLPGYGLSDPPVHGGSREGWAGDVAEIIGELGRGSANLHGIATGGSIALAVAAAYPSLVARVAVGGVLVRPDRAALLMRATWKEAARASGMQAVADLMAVAGYSRAYLESPDGEAAIEWMRRVFRQGVPARYVRNTTSAEGLDLGVIAAQVKAPVLVIACRDDPITPLEAAGSGLGIMDLHRFLPSSELVVLEDSGHCYYVERARDAAALVAQFFRQETIVPPAKATLIQ